MHEWPAGRRCPLGRLREAWVAHRYGLARAVDTGGAMAGIVSPDQPARVVRAIELYEAFAEHRPPGWPVSGAAALCVLASQHRADVLAGDVARLKLLAKGMRAAGLIDDADRLRRARRRAVARRDPPPSSFGFRIRPRPARIETSEVRRQRVRDAVLLLGSDPASWPNAELALHHLPITPTVDGIELLGEDRCEELGGIGARATRYRRELDGGLWRLL